MTPQEVLRASVPDRKRFGWSLALGVLANVSAVALLGTSMWLITRASEQPPIMFLSFAIVGVRAFALGRAAFRYAERLASHDSVFRQLPALRVRLFERLAELAPWGVTGARRGDTLSRFVRDVDELQFYPLRVLLPSIATLSVVLVSCIAVGLLSWLAALGITAALALGTLLAAWVTLRSSRQSAVSIAPARGLVADRVLDAVSNWDVLVAFGADRQAAQAVAQAGSDLSQRERRIASRGGLANALLILGGGLAVTFAALGVTPTVAAGALSVPGAAVAILLPIALTDLLSAIPLAVHARGQAEGAARRIAELLPESAPEGIPDEHVELALPRRQLSAHPRLRFEHAQAQYPGTARPSLRDVSFELAPAELVLLTGPSGAGKSTIAQVAVRLLDYRGSVTLDGVELRDLGADQVREQLVLCEQQPWLFHSTIRGNLQFAHPGTSDAELEAVIARVGLGEWMRERGGLDAEVGERGELVSGGEAQRIALARALLSSAPIIVCDEPTANVDPERADQLLRDIASLSPERSVLLISHQELPKGVPHRRLQIVAGDMPAR